MKKYKILWNLEDGDPSGQNEEEVGGDLVEYTIVDLQADTWYQVRMAAKTMQYGPFSDWVSVKTWIEEGPNVTSK